MCKLVGWNMREYFMAFLLAMVWTLLSGWLTMAVFMWSASAAPRCPPLLYRRHNDTVAGGCNITLCCHKDEPSTFDWITSVAPVKVWHKTSRILLGADNTRLKEIYTLSPVQKLGEMTFLSLLAESCHLSETFLSIFSYHLIYIHTLLFCAVATVEI